MGRRVNRKRQIAVYRQLLKQQKIQEDEGWKGALFNPAFVRSLRKLESLGVDPQRADDLKFVFERFPQPHHWKTANVDDLLDQVAVEFAAVLVERAKRQNREFRQAHQKQLRCGNRELATLSLRIAGDALRTGLERARAMRARAV